MHLIFLIGFRNRLAVLRQWAYSYFAYKRGARIITGLPQEQLDVVGRGRLAPQTREGDRPRVP